MNDHGAVATLLLLHHYLGVTAVLLFLEPIGLALDLGSFTSLALVLEEHDLPLVGPVMHDQAAALAMDAAHALVDR